MFRSSSWRPERMCRAPEGTVYDDARELNLASAIIEDTRGNQLRGYDICMKMPTSLWRTRKEGSGDIGNT